MNAYASDFYPDKTATKIVKKVLKDKAIALDSRVEIEGSANKTEPVCVYKVTFPGSEKLAYAVFTQAKGRYDLFDYIIIISDDFMIQRVQVIKYRSEHGGEIAAKTWLSQFENYTTGNLKYGTDISAISGATISAKSITSDIPRVLNLIKESNLLN